MFAQTDGEHHGVLVYQNLLNVLNALSVIDDLNCIVFTGDLTQDHSIESYQLFQQAFSYAIDNFDLECDLYWLAGNHDELELLQLHLTHDRISAAKNLELEHWQLILVNSKSDTPAGFVNNQELSRIEGLSQNKNSLVFMHHHPIDVNYFIDKHGLLNKTEFWQVANQCKNIKGIFHGHIHQGMTIDKSSEYSIPVHACPATSIQFDPNSTTVSALRQGPGYRLINLFNNDKYTTELFYLDK